MRRWNQEDTYPEDPGFSAGGQNIGDNSFVASINNEEIVDKNLEDFVDDALLESTNDSHESGSNTGVVSLHDSDSNADIYIDTEIYSDSGSESLLDSASDSEGDEGELF